MSKKLSNRYLELMQSVELIERLKAEIRYNATEIKQLIIDIQNSECFSKLLFLKECSQLMTEGLPFPKAWEESLQLAESNFDSNDLEQLIYLSKVLGATDIQGQMSSLDMVEENLKNNLIQAEQNCQTKGKMYRSMGVLSGIAVAILTI